MNGMHADRCQSHCLAVTVWRSEPDRLDSDCDKGVQMHGCVGKYCRHKWHLLALRSLPCSISSMRQTCQCQMLHVTCHQSDRFHSRSVSMRQTCQFPSEGGVNVKVSQAVHVLRLLLQTQTGQLDLEITSCIGQTARDRHACVFTKKAGKGAGTSMGADLGVARGAGGADMQRMTEDSKRMILVSNVGRLRHTSADMRRMAVQALARAAGRCLHAHTSTDTIDCGICRMI